MGRILRRFLDEDRGQVGIGTLIIFIAMILVAAVAAGVLLRTSGTLSTKATATGEQATTEVSTQIKIVKVIGYDGPTSNGDINAIILTAQLASGSGDVNYDDIILSYQSGDKYFSGISYNATDAITITPGDSDDMQFNVKRLKNENADSILESGETIELIFWIEDTSGTDSALAADTEFIMSVQPKAGQTTSIKKTTPSVISQNYIIDWS